MHKEIVIPNATNLVTYRKIKAIVASIGCSIDTKLYLDNTGQMKMLVEHQNIIDQIIEQLKKHNIHSIYVEVGD